METITAFEGPIIDPEELITKFGHRVIPNEDPSQNRLLRLVGLHPPTAEEIIRIERKAAAGDLDCLQPPGDALPVPGVSRNYGGPGNFFIKIDAGLVEVTGFFHNGDLLYLVPPDPHPQISW